MVTISLGRTEKLLNIFVTFTLRKIARTRKSSSVGGVQPVGRRIGVDNEPAITLHCIRKNGRRERTSLTHHSLSEARDLAQGLLRVGNGLYTEVDICTEDGTIETIQNPAMTNSPSEVLLVEDNAGDALLVGQALGD